MKNNDFDIFLEKYDPIPVSTEEFYYMVDNWRDSEEWEKIKQANTENKVWTVIDGEDSELWIIPGLHIVNRIGYIICNKSFEENTDEEYKY